MNVIVSTAPESPKDWPAWLEKQLVGLHLGELIEELSITATGQDDLDVILTPDQLQEIKQKGLTVLELDKLRQLLNSPPSLLTLQEEIFIDGGQYWESVPRTSEHQHTADESATKVIDTVRHQVATDRSRRWYAAVSGVVAIAALFLIGFFLLPDGGQAPPQPGGGQIVAKTIIDLPDSIANGNPTPEQFYKSFAEASYGWYGIKPSSNQELVELGQKLSQEFDQHIAANPLSGKHQGWFVKKCSEWQSKVNDVVATLATVGLELREGREQLDDIVMKMIDALNKGPSQEDLDSVG